MLGFEKLKRLLKINVEIVEKNIFFLTLNVKKTWYGGFDKEHPFFAGFKKYF
jgi:hypothetical protein